MHETAVRGHQHMKAQAYRIRSLKRFSAALRQPYIIELPLLDQLREGLDRFFDRDFGINSRTFK